jgi:hypothetical protein
MSATARLHGIRPLVYLDGTELVACRAYTITIARDSAESGAFGETWKGQKGGLLGASGNLDTYLEHDQKLMYSAATKANQASATLLIYPNRSDIADVISCSAFFGAGFSGDTGSMQMAPGDFVVDGAVTLTGFS